MKNLLNICIFLLFFYNISACSYNDNTVRKNIEQETQVELSTEDKLLIDEYNKILQHLTSGNEENFLQELNYFLPKVEKIKNNKEKNNILINIYIQQKQYKKAYDLNNQLLKNTPGDFNRHIFQCQLLEIMDKPLTEIEKCYEILSLKIKDQIKNMPKKDSESLENIFSYYVILYKAGHTEYAKEIQNLINSISDPEMKVKLQNHANILLEKDEYNSNTIE